MNFLTTPPQPTSGRMLTQNEIKILDAINGFPYPALIGYSSIGAINNKVPVEIQSKKKPPHKVTVHYDLEEIKRLRDEANQNVKAAREAFDAALSNGEDANEKERELGRWSNLFSYYKRILTKGCPDNEIEVPWLGCYVPSEKKVILYIDQIGKNNINRLVSTYVHEMFHAYFDTNSAEEKIEEPIVEYAMLCFLKAYDNKYNTSYFRIAYDDVKKKQWSPGIAHYGFGAYLFDQQSVDWVKEYKDNNSRTLSAHAEYNNYMNSFAGVYPADKEHDCMQVLYRIITDKKQLPKGLSIKQSKNPVQVGGVIINPQWNNVFKHSPRCFYDQTTKTLGFDGDWCRKRCINGITEVEVEVELYTDISYTNIQITQIYLGDHFVIDDYNDLDNLLSKYAVIVSPANKHYYAKKGVAFHKKDNTPVLEECGNGLYQLCRYGKWGVVDCQLKQIVPCKYGFIWSFDTNDLVMVRDYNSSNLCGLVNKQGKVQVPVIYEDIANNNDGTYTVKQNGSEFIIDIFGKKI